MSDFKEKARRARERTAAAATRLKDAVTHKAGDAKDFVTSGASDLRDAGASKIRDTLDDFNATLPTLREAGYTLKEVDISIGIPPKIVASFHAADTANEEGAARVIEEHKDQKLTVFLLRSLMRASKLQSSVHIADMKPHAISVEMGLTPGVTVKFE
jgi:hypothetical protein